MHLATFIEFNGVIDFYTHGEDEIIEYNKGFYDKIEMGLVETHIVKIDNICSIHEYENEKAHDFHSWIIYKTGKILNIIAAIETVEAIKQTLEPHMMSIVEVGEPDDI